MPSQETQNEPVRRAVVLTALREEYLAVHQHLSEIKDSRHPAGTIYETGKFSTGQGPLWEISIAEIGVGNARAAFEAERAIGFLKPAVALFVGVAGGLKDVCIGDVVAATKVYGYESGKAGGKFQPRPDVGMSTYRMEQCARAEARRDNWRKRITAESNAQPRVFVGPIAAGEKVVASHRSSVHKFLRSAYSDALAVDMEGRGFLDATHANQDVEALVIRGISDLIQGKAQADSQGSQRLAARHASAFAFEVLSKIEVAARWFFVVTGTVADVDKPLADAIVDHLRKLSGDAMLTLRRIEAGSVVFVLDGSLDGFEIIQQLFTTGRLVKVAGLHVLDVRLAQDVPLQISTPATSEFAPQTPNLVESTRLQRKKSVLTPIRIAVVERDPSRFASLKSLFDKEQSLDLISCSLAELAPRNDIDLILLGTLAGQNLFDVMAGLKAARPDLRIIVRGSGADDETILKALAAGAKGYVDEAASPAEFIQAMRLVNQGSVWAPRRVVSIFVERVTSSPGRISPVGRVTFTDREKEILELLVAGRSNREISSALGIDERRVKFHVARLMRKVEVQNRIALSVDAISALMPMKSSNK